jgi:hypothetical protein
MSFVTPGTVIAGEVLTAVRWNQDVVANTEALFVGHRLVETVYFTTPGAATFTKATYPWLRAIRVKCQGAGGGGGGSAATAPNEVSVGSGGVGGTYQESFLTDIAGLASSVTVTVGAGGSGGAPGSSGSAGGASSFGALVSAAGGGGGFSGGASGVPRTTNCPTTRSVGTDTGDLRIFGNFPVQTTILSVDFPNPSQGGTSFLSANQTNNPVAVGGQNGNDGILYGGGAGGGVRGQNQGTGATGGTGANGIVIVELYA